MQPSVSPAPDTWLPKLRAGNEKSYAELYGWINKALLILDDGDRVLAFLSYRVPGLGRHRPDMGSRRQAGRFEDWLEILHLAERSLTPEAVVISEMVTPNWTNLRPLIQGRYRALAECDIDFLTDDHRSQRSFRLFRPKLE